VIKSTKTTIKYANTAKVQTLHLFVGAYKELVQYFVDQIWDLDKVPSLLPKEITADVDTWLSARVIQCAGKQASRIVRGTRTKQAKRLAVINKLNKQGRYKQARKLQRIYNNVKTTKPLLKNCSPELDSRFIKIDLDNETSFDGWVSLNSLGDLPKLKIPFKRTKHFNAMLLKGSQQLS